MTIPSAEDIHRLQEVEIPVEVIIGEKRMFMHDLLGLAVGDTIGLGKKHTEQLSITVNERPVAHGKAVKVGARIGIEVTRVKSAQEIIRSFGP